MAYLRWVKLGSVVLLATFVSVYIHEWGHGLAFALSGYRPCIGINNSWPAPPYEDVKTLAGGLAGPLTSLALGLLFMVLHFFVSHMRNETFAISLVNFVAHPIFVFFFVLSVLLFDFPIFLDDEATLALMMPSAEADTAWLQGAVASINRGFLLRPWSIAVIWPLLLLPAALISFLAWRGKPVAGGGTFRFTATVVGLTIASAFIHAEFAKVAWVICF